MPIEPLDIFCYFNVQRFTQFGAMDCANWYREIEKDTKKDIALYPCMGRRHIRYFEENKLIFTEEPKALFKTINYAYFIVGTRVIQVDRFYNERIIGSIPLGKTPWFANLQVGSRMFAILTAETKSYLIIEDGTSISMQEITDPNRPMEPYFVAAFGNRFSVSNKDSTDYYLTAINVTDLQNPATCFTVNGASLFNRASGIVRQFGVLHNQLYIFTDFSTEVWANIPSQINVAGQISTFPWKINSSYNFDFGIQDPFSLSIDFGRMIWLAKNTNGLVSFMMSTGGQPQDIGSQAVNVLIENSREDEGLSPFITDPVNGFLYQYENTILYRVSAGRYNDSEVLDINQLAQSIEYNFETQTWGRVIELNGQRNRIEKHIYFNNVHLVTVQGDPAVYEMGGNIYHNELRKPDTEPNAVDAFQKYPFRYELKTSQIFLPDYAEFITDWIEIDFVFGFKTFFENNAPFANTVFIITEDAASDGSPIFQIAEDQQIGEDVFLITEDGNTPAFDDNHYNALFKPHIELYYSDDGGMTFLSADLRRFSPLGNYRWQMRWNELGTSRNRCYMLIAVSSAPIVILGAIQNIRRASGGAC